MMEVTAKVKVKSNQLFFDSSHILGVAVGQGGASVIWNIDYKKEGLPWFQRCSETPRKILRFGRVQFKLFVPEDKLPEATILRVVTA